MMKFVNFDKRFKYEGFNRDFGPLNLGHVTEYCREIDRLVKNSGQSSSIIKNGSAHRRKSSYFSNDSDSDASGGEMPSHSSNSYLNPLIVH